MTVWLREAADREVFQLGTPATMVADETYKMDFAYNIHRTVLTAFHKQDLWMQAMWAQTEEQKAQYGPLPCISYGSNSSSLDDLDTPFF